MPFFREIPDGRATMFIGVVPPGSKLVAETDARSNVVTLKSADITDWQRNHPALAHMTPEKIVVEDALKLQVPREWDVLARSGHNALIVANGVAGHRQIVVAFNVQDSNWPLRISFPEFIAGANSWLTGSVDVLLKHPTGELRVRFIGPDGKPVAGMRVVPKMAITRSVPTATTAALQSQSLPWQTPSWLPCPQNIVAIRS